MSVSVRKRARLSAEVVAHHAAGLHNAAIRREVGINDSFINILLAENGLTRNPTPRPGVTTEHGTISMFARCKCDKCREAKRAYRAERIAARGTDFLDDPDRVHGEYSTWSAGCRCGPCRSADRAWKKARNDGTRVTARSHGEVWSAEDDELALDMSKTIREIATELGRTWAAVTCRRTKLRKRGDAAKKINPQST